jgi:heat shock protein 4
MPTAFVYVPFFSLFLAFAPSHCPFLFQRAITQFGSFVLNQEAKYAHITAEERQKILTAANEAGSWLAGEEAKQEKLALNQDPVLTTTQLNKKRIDLETFCNGIINKPKPDTKPEPKKEEPKKEEPKKDEAKEDKKDQPQPEKMDTA